MSGSASVPPPRSRLIVDEINLLGTTHSWGGVTTGSLGINRSPFVSLIISFYFFNSWTSSLHLRYGPEDGIFRGATTKNYMRSRSPVTNDPQPSLYEDVLVKDIQKSMLFVLLYIQSDSCTFLYENTLFITICFKFMNVIYLLYKCPKYCTL